MAQQKMDISKKQHKQLEMEQKKRDEEIFTWRVLGVFAVIAVLLIVLMQLQKYYIVNSEQTRQALYWTSIVLGVIAIASGAAVISRMLSNVRNPQWLLLVTGSSLILCVAALFIRTYGAHSVTTMYIVLPVVGIMYLLYYIYQREFILLAILTTFGSIGLWGLSKLLSQSKPHINPLVAELIFIGMIAFSFALLFLLRKKNGKLCFGKSVLEILQGDANYRFLFIACALLVLAVVATMLFGWAVAWYAMVAMFGYLFIMAVYYTVKLV